MTLFTFLEPIVAEIYLIESENRPSPTPAIAANDMYMVQARRAYRYISAFTGRKFMLATYDHICNYDIMIELPEDPVTAINSIRFLNSEDPIPDTEYTLDNNVIFFDQATPYDPTDKIIINYDGGFSTIPEDEPLFEAFILQAVSLFETRKMMAVKEIPSQYNTSLSRDVGSLLHEDVRLILQSYRVH